ncbi:hypothetical protein [Mycobacteroides abscessus]|uniref:hypothetical protein n=1 Tax=Mycobacteroides abscessus TaxID=36809 RepID=UPI000C2656FC|nr:hypothetical protein [Mycobacteroides abscessus]
MGRSWTSDELAVALDLSLSRREAAARLGRTDAAVKWARLQYGAGKPVERQRRRRWTAEEIAIALDVSLTKAQAAAKLGRSVSSVKAVRISRLGSQRGETGDAAKKGQPWSAEELAIAADRSIEVREAARRLGRTVAAVRRQRVLTGVRSRPMPEDAHGTVNGHEMWGCRCEECVAVYRQWCRQCRQQMPDEFRANAAAGQARWKARNPEKVSQHRREQAENKMLLTMPAAHQHKQPWRVEEIEVALDMSLTAVQAALRLGRTAHAVQNARTAFADPARQPAVRRWTDDEVQFARDDSLTDEQVAERTGRTITAVARKRAHLAHKNNARESLASVSATA